jgi:pyridoxine/pyridoxamine 5'-phosphate oxidase
MPEPIVSRPAFAGHEETLPWAWAERRLVDAWNYWLATAAPGRGPYVRPIWALWCDAGLLFTTSPSSRKARDFLAEPGVSVHAELEREVVVVDGTVREASPTEADTPFRSGAAYRLLTGSGSNRRANRRALLQLAPELA